MKDIHIDSSLINSDEFRFVKQSLINASEKDGQDAYRVKTLEYINDSCENDEDMFFYDMMEFIRFLDPSDPETQNHIAYTTPDMLIFFNMPCDYIKNSRQWDFTHDHECLHQLWETFDVADKIRKEGIEYNHQLMNIASDCVINQYLRDIRKKECSEGLVTPELLKAEFGVEYDYKTDTQYTLYLKLLKVYKEAYEQMEKFLKNHPELMDDQDGDEGESGESGGSGGSGESDESGESGKSGQSSQSGKSENSGSQSDKQNNQGGGGEKDDKDSKEDGGQDDNKKDSGKSSESADDAAKRAQDAANKAKDKAEKSGNSDDAKNAEDAKNASDKAKDAANRANNASNKEEKDKATKEAQDAADEAEKAANGDKDGKNNKGNDKKPGTDIGNSNTLTEDLDKIRKQAKDVIEKYRKRISGDFGDFISKCKSSLALNPSGLKVETKGRGAAGWAQKMKAYVNAFVKKKIFQKKREFEPTYKRMNKRQGVVHAGDTIQKGKRVKKNGLTINAAFYIDRSGSMSGDPINNVFDASYAICESLKKQFKSDKVVDEITFKMHAFDFTMHELKFGKKMTADGGTMPFDKILDYISKNTKDFMINIIITDAGFNVDENEVKRLIKDIDGMLLFIANNDENEEMKKLSKEFSTKLFYVLADANFSL